MSNGIAPNRVHTVSSNPRNRRSTIQASSFSLWCYPNRRTDWFHCGVKIPDQSQLMTAADNVNGTRKLQRRLDPGGHVQPINGGPTSACDPQGYNSGSVLGVCLWSGNSNVPPDADHYPGWVSWSHRANCGRKIYVVGKDGETIYVQVLDTCGFDDSIREESDGCSRIGITMALEDKLGGAQNLASWDFDDAVKNPPN